MIRKTISLPDDLAAEVDRLVADGHAPNVSRLVTAALRSYVDGLRAQRLAQEGTRLDPAEEVALARGGPAGVERRSPWSRVP